MQDLMGAYNFCQSIVSKEKACKFSLVQSYFNALISGKICSQP